MERKLSKKSLGARIFAFVTLLVVALVAFISGKNGFYLFDTLKRQYQANLIDSVQLQGFRYSSGLGRLDAKLIMIAQSLQRSSPTEFQSLALNLQDTEPGLVTLQFVSSKDAGTSLYFGPSDGKSELLATEIRAIKFERQLAIQGHPRNKNLFLLAREMKDSKSSITNIFLVAFNVKKVFEGSDSQSQQKLFLLDRKQIDLLTNKPYRSNFKDPTTAKKISTILGKDLGSGYLGETKSDKDTFYIAFQNLHPYPATLVVHQRTTPIQTAILGFFTEIFQWTLLFLLLAILFTWYLVNGLISHLKILTKATQDIAHGNFDVQIPQKSDDEIGYLAESFRWMTKKLVLLLEKEREKARLEQELVTAQTVQNTFFKHKTLDTLGISLHAHYKPASECSGDLWGQIKLGDNLELVYLGDATGHGAPAALITAMAFAAVNVRSTMYNKGECSTLNPSDILRTLNELLWNTLEGKLCMSFLILIFDREKTCVTYSNAGHTYPYLIPQSKSDSRLSGKKRFTSLSTAKRVVGILGIDPQAVFVDEVLTLQEGDRIILYTDGLTEAKNKNGKMWGTRGLQKVIEEYGEEPADQLKTQMMEKVTEFNEKKDEFEDDLTLLIIDFHAEKLQAVA